MATTNFKREIKKILTNDFKKNLKGKIPQLLSPEQIKLLKKYKTFYESKKSCKGGIIKTSSVWNSLVCLRQLGLFLNKPYEKATKNDLINFFTKQMKDKSEATTSAWKVTIRSFYKWHYGIRKKHEFPEVVDDERLEPTRAPPRKVSPNDLFTKDEVLKMINSCYNPMDKAIISIWYEMGIRASEYTSANIGSVVFVSGGCKFFVEESKTERGFVPLIQSAPYLEEWLRIHPYKDNPEAPLFVAMKRRKKGELYKRLKPNGINQKLKRIAVRSGIKKRIFTHLGRNISITRLDGTMSIEDNARLHGITPSTILNVYTRRSRKEACENYFNINGREKTDEEKVSEKKEKDKLLPKKCENCGTINPFDKNFCDKCLRPIDLKTFVELENSREVKDKVVTRSIEKGALLNKDLVKELLREMIKAGEIQL